MKTTIDIPREALREAMRITGARTKREAVVTAITEFNRRRRLEKLAEELGTFEEILPLEDLLKLRQSE